MSDYPTPDEEYEHLYGDDLQALDDLNTDEIYYNEVVRPPPKKPCTPLSNLPNYEGQQFSQHLLQQNVPRTTEASQQLFNFMDSPQLSQIPLDTVLSSVNRKLFGTPMACGQQQQSSTPIRTTTASTTPLAEPLPNSQSSNPPIDSNYSNNQRKRRLEDLFGDIHDIEDADYFGYDNIQLKKYKTQDEIDVELIEKILDARKRYQINQMPLNKNQHLSKLEALHKFKKQNLSLKIPQWPFITLKHTANNERIYVRMHSEEYEDTQIKNINFENNFVNLLGESKEQIWNQAQSIIEKQLLKSTNTTDDVEAPIIIDEYSSDFMSHLWVEKYRPKKYLDLLSDETTNRSLLSWLKMWDKIVFNREFKTKPLNTTDQRHTFNKRTKKFEQNGGWRRKFERNTLKFDVDDLGRPIQKIALLCGPPGLGKTTLAHTIARHAGYAVREINASDDRNLDSFKQTLENCTQMNSVLSQDKRPNCIILDEIDGAPQTSIDFLIRFINDNVGQQQKSSTANSKKGKNKNVILKRPIICICNDMYTPALRQLRQIALVVNFPPMESARLAERLQYITRIERIKTDMTSLLTLSEKTGNDVRSCLSMLQFYNIIKKPLTIIDVLKSNLGQKDRQKNLFNVWSTIFQIHRPFKSISVDDKNENTSDYVSMTETSLKTRMDNVLDAVHMGGDYERLMNGVYENYLTQKMPDPNMNGVAEATVWFCFSDRIQRIINQQQNYDIYPYLQYGFVIWNYLFASLAWTKINFPNKSFENLQKSTLNKLTQNALRKGFSASSSRGLGDGHAIILDTIPYLKRILSPSLRSVSLQLLTPKEQQDLRHTVDIMADLGLSYTQIKSIDGKFQYQMEPDIDMLCKFENKISNDEETSLSYWSRQLIAREVDLEKMRRAVPKCDDENVEKRQRQQQKQQQLHKQNEIKNKQNDLPNFKKTLQPKIIHAKNVKETLTKDFFGRISSKETIITVQEGGSDAIVKSPIWYRYKEGFNNAVRKDVTIINLI